MLLINWLSEKLFGPPAEIEITVEETNPETLIQALILGFFTGTLIVTLLVGIATCYAFNYVFRWGRRRQVANKKPKESVRLESSEADFERIENAVEALPIVETHERTAEHRFTLNEEALREVAVISVAGAFRKGKSFLLNFFIRYLQTLEHNDGRKDETWLEAKTAFNVFSWRNGRKPETNGILICKRPFLVRNSKGEEIAVLLMDTQGAFDSRSTVTDCATIFALSTMVSSVQIYNLSQNIQEDNLQHLELFTDYGRLALNNESSKPFQDLVFLVRDWSCPDEADFGFGGGHEVLEEFLRIPAGQPVELGKVRRNIRDCFRQIRCFLMPYPGEAVASSGTFRGQLDEISKKFRDSLRELIPGILDGQKLVVKEVNGHAVTCRELFQLFKSYMEIFQSDTLPMATTMLEATSKANNLCAVEAARNCYNESMELVCRPGSPFIQSSDLNTLHDSCKRKAVQKFRNTPKMGGAEYGLPFLEELVTHIDKHYATLRQINDAKKVTIGMLFMEALSAFLTKWRPYILLLMAVVVVVLAVLILPGFGLIIAPILLIGEASAIYILFFGLLLVVFRLGQYYALRSVKLRADGCAKLK
ncbi:unnamed protein product, partial [Mesorhabditis spiculigera]